MIGSLMMCTGVVILLVGMLMGIAMGIQQDFTLAPAHAHLNLVGGVLLFLFGLYYRLVPAAGNRPLARLQGWLHIAGAILFPAGVAIVMLRAVLRRMAKACDEISASIYKTGAKEVSQIRNGAEAKFFAIGEASLRPSSTLNHANPFAPSCTTWVKTF